MPFSDVVFLFLANNLTHPFLNVNLLYFYGYPATLLAVLCRTVALSLLAATYPKLNRLVILFTNNTLPCAFDTKSD